MAIALPILQVGFEPIEFNPLIPGIKALIWV